MINFINVTLTAGEKTLLKNVEFSLPENSQTLLMGKSGVGKSVLFASILGFHPIKSGEIQIDNKILNSQHKEMIRSNIAYLPQKLYLPAGRVLDSVQTIFNLKQNTHLDFSKQKFIEIIKKLNLEEDILLADFKKLSGGEKQRVALAVLLMLERKIFILDEPTSALDSQSKISAIKLIKESQATALIVSHDKEWHQHEGFEKLELPWVQKN
jgi:ABC-type multidrug transport system ATPase subunit